MAGCTEPVRCSPPFGASVDVTKQVTHGVNVVDQAAATALLPPRRPPMPGFVRANARTDKPMLCLTRPQIPQNPRKRIFSEISQNS
jgi:hypothetical protein